MISITDGQPVQALPLIFVVLISMVKDAFEDYKRAKSDKEENDAKTMVYDPQSAKFVEGQWKALTPGSIIRITDEEYVPADIVLLKSSDPKGECYIETKGLDGETNLKLKTAAKEVAAMF